MSRKDSSLIYTVIVVGAFAPIAWMLMGVTKDTSIGPNPSTEQQRSGVFQRDEKCGNVVQSCVASVDFVLNDCSKAAVTKKVEEALAHPLDVGECRAVLARACRPGCRLRQTSMIVIPGTIETAIPPPDDFGQCQVRAKRPVSIQATCVHF